MPAAFPNGIVQFTPKRNITDVIDANDIDRIQDEIVAIQQVLGAEVLQVNSIEVLTNQALTNAAQAQNQAAVATALAQGAQTTALNDQTQINKIIKFDNMQLLLDYTLEGRGKHAVVHYGVNHTFPITAPYGKTSYISIAYTKPSVSDDPMSMYNGNGFTLKKSGYWDLLFNAQVTFNQTNGTSLNKGLFEACIFVNGHPIDHGQTHHSSELVNGRWKPLHLSIRVKGWFPAGTQIGAGISQDSGAAQLISTHLALHRVRA